MGEETTVAAAISSTTKTLKFYGVLAKEFQSTLSVVADTPRQAIQIAEANRPGLVSGHLASGMYLVLLDGKPVDRAALDKSFPVGSELQFVPVIAGSIFGIDDLIIAVIVAVVVSVGLSLLLAPGAPKDITEDSASFQSAVNVTAEGTMMPIILGKTRVGSVVLSSERALGRSTFTAGGYDPTTFNWVNSIDANFEFSPELSYQNNSLVSRQLHAISEGPILGLERGARDVLFNDTQLQADDGTNSFEGARHEFAAGTDPNDELILIQDSATELDPVVVTELKTTDRVVRTVSANIDAVRVLIKTPAFFRSRSNGDQDPLTVLVHIDKRITGSGDSWERAATMTIRGVINVERFFETVITLDNANQYDISVNRATEHSTGIKIQDTLVFENLIEIVRSRVRYDGTALVGVEFDNESFGGRNPTTEFIAAGLIVDVPTNYDPEARTYTGTWDGTYKKAYTNNPAFLIQHMMTNNVYGLGAYISDRFSKSQLYTLGQFCDVEVPDGENGLEPRYTLNYRLTERKKAMVVIRELAGVFRGQAFWDGTEIGFIYDQDRTVSHVFTPANVIDGEFEYTGADTSSRVNRATVSFFDKNDRYRESFQAYQDHARYEDEGPNEREVESFSTSPGQAQRQARFIVENSVGDIVKFASAEEAGRLLPGQLLAVYDTVLMGRDTAGRTATGSTTTSIQLDRGFEVEAGKTYDLTLTLADGTIEERRVISSAGTHTALTVSAAFTEAPPTAAVWAITASDLEPRYFLLTDRSHQGNGVFALTCSEYVDGLFEAIESGTKVDRSAETILPNPDSIDAPDNLVYRAVPYLEDTFRGDIHFGWSAVSGAVGYDVYYSVKGGPLQSLALGVRDNSVVLNNAAFGDYVFSVKSRTETFSSPLASLEFRFDESSVAQVPYVSGLELFEQGLNTEYQNQDAKFVWRYSQSATFDFELDEDGFGLDSGAGDPFFKEFIIEIKDTNGSIRRTVSTKQNYYEYTFERNLEDGTPARAFQFVIRSRDIFNRVSEPVCLNVTNPQIGKITDANLEPSLGAAVLNYPVPEGTDWAGTRIHVSDTSGFTPGDENLRYDVKSSSIPITAMEGETLYVRMAAYDTFGIDGLNYSDELTVTIPAGANAIALLSYMTPQYGDMAGLTAADFDVESGTVQLVQSPVYVGNQSICLDATNSSQTTWFSTDKANDLNLNLPRGRRWMLTGWFRTVNANPANAGLRAILRGNLGAENANIGTAQALSAANVWERVGFVIDLQSNDESSFVVGVRSTIGTTVADLYMDGFSLFDVTDLPQYDEANLPPVVYVPSLAAGVAADGTDGQPGLPGASTVLKYNDLSVGAAAGPRGSYSFGTNLPNETYAGTQVWSDLTSGNVQTFYIHRYDQNEVLQEDFLSTRTVGESITWLQSNRRWVEFRIEAAPVYQLDRLWAFEVSLVEFNQTDGNQNVDGADDVPIELRFSGAKDGEDGNDGTDGKTIDLPAIVTRGLSSNIEIIPNELSDHTANPGEYFIGAGVVLLPDGTSRTIANNVAIITPFEGVQATLAGEQYNSMHFLVSGATPAGARFGFDNDNDPDPFDEGLFSMLVDFTTSPYTYSAVGNFGVLVTFTPLETDFVLGAGYKSPTSTGGIEHFTPYFTRVTDTAATAGARLGDNMRSLDNELLYDIDLRNDLLVQNQFSSVNTNPNLTFPRAHNEGHGPAGWYSANDAGSDLPTYTDYPNSTDIVRIPFNKNMANSAFRVNPRVTYEVVALVRAESGTLMPGLRVQELDSDFEQGKSVVGWEFTTPGKEAPVVTATRSFTVKSQTVGNEWVLLFGFYTPTATAIWASIDLWTGNQGSSAMQVDYALISERATTGAQLGTDVVDEDGVVIVDNDIKNNAVLRQNNPVGLWWENYSGNNHAPSSTTYDANWIIYDGDDNVIANYLIRATLNANTSVVTLSEPNGRPSGVTVDFPSGQSGNGLTANLTYTHPTTGRTLTHSMTWGVINTGGGGGK